MENITTEVRELTDQEVSGALTPDEAAARVGISARMMRRYCRNGIGGKWKGRWLIPENELENFERVRRTPGRPRLYEPKAPLAATVLEGLTRRHLEFTRNAQAGKNGLRYDFLVAASPEHSYAIVIDNRSSHRDQSRFEERMQRLQKAAKTDKAALLVVDRETKFPDFFRQLAK